MDLDNVKVILSNAGYKLTPQREAILEVLINNQDKHLTAEEVLNEARKEMPNIGIATVYRTLDNLVSMDILDKNMFEGERYRYELSNADNQPHHHIICLKCNSIVEVEEDLLHNMEAQLEAKGFKIIDRELKFFGYCPQCNK